MTGVYVLRSKQRARLYNASYQVGSSKILIFQTKSTNCFKSQVYKSAMKKNYTFLQLIFLWLEVFQFALKLFLFLFVDFQ